MPKESRKITKFLCSKEGMYLLDHSGVVRSSYPPRSGYLQAAYSQKKIHFTFNMLTICLYLENTETFGL